MIGWPLRLSLNNEKQTWSPEHRQRGTQAFAAIMTQR